jgi:hypothetical protein
MSLTCCPSALLYQQSILAQLLQPLPVVCVPSPPPLCLRQVLKGDEHAVAILPQGFKVEGLAEVGDALVLRVRDASAAAELRKKLVQSGSQMAAVAGLLQVRYRMGGGGCWTLCLCICCEKGHPGLPQDGRWHVVVFFLGMPTANSIHRYAVQQHVQGYLFHSTNM